MEVHGYILHLTRAHARQENAHALLQTLNDMHTVKRPRIWEAVDGANLSAEDLSAIVHSGVFEPQYPFGLKPGEVGCFLSHRQIWGDLLIHGSGAALIIEDDAQIDLPVFSQALALAAENIERMGYIQFQTRAPKGPTTLVDMNGPCRLTVPRLGGLRTTAQMVSLQAARLLLTRSERIDRPVDTFVQSHWHTGLRPAIILPSGIRETRLETTIQQGRKPIWQKLKREVLRSVYRRQVARYSHQSPAPEAGGLPDA